jgi:ribosomal protein L11 methyltransferase
LTSGAWTSVRVRTPGDRAAVISALFSIGAEGVQELDQEVLTHLRDVDETLVSAAIHRADAAATVHYEATPNVDWASAWRSRLRAHRVGPLVVTPPWLAGEYAASERVVIDPGMAFGTGDHETTRGVIRLLSRHLRPGDTVADLGAGSAVLSIAAARLGASRVVAIEIDPEAIGNAEENVERNGVGGIVSVLEGDAGVLLPLVAPVRMVLANIISSVLLSMLPTVAESLSTGGVAVLSGILVEEKGSVEGAAQSSGWRVLDTDQEGAWWSVALGR